MAPSLTHVIAAQRIADMHRDAERDRKVPREDRPGRRTASEPGRAKRRHLPGERALIGLRHLL